MFRSLVLLALGLKEGMCDSISYSMLINCLVLEAGWKNFFTGSINDLSKNSDPR
jgi:hypothetical protein